MGRNHNDESKLVQELRRVVREESGFKSLRKNGDSWSGWIGKLATPDRILWLIMAIFVLGGRVDRYTTDIAEALDDVKILNNSQAQFTHDLVDLRGLITMMEDQQKQETTTRATKADIANLQDLIRTMVTRQELQSMLRQQVIPRLDRIDND